MKQPRQADAIHAEIAKWEMKRISHRNNRLEMIQFGAAESGDIDFERRWEMVSAQVVCILTWALDSSITELDIPTFDWQVRNL